MKEFKIAKSRNSIKEWRFELLTLEEDLEINASQIYFF